MTNTKTSGGQEKTKQIAKEIMVVHDDPGIETRIAILENGRLEELYTERTKTATGVGNIYKGRVTNVESAIQAAFIEYGGLQSGFLHVTDLHPKYFPGKEKSERVGKKIAKHQRPPIQNCLKRGDEVLVQVLKEGIGTKGPTLTSYLSVPGRLSVMMPFMNKVGVSRKIEDEDERRKMRKVLDSINLPEGYGFILRTAGLGKNKTEVKRDIAYLIRMWKMIQKRIDSVGAPCALYNESDLLVRTVRDILRPSIIAVVVDSESAYERISSFLKIAAPRSARKVVMYREASPVFHAFDIEKQIEEVHNREVHLPSGGRLVIDQTEALVAIDVNSGKSRGAKNSESNALNTNLEAADEICRQLRLRDLGGIVVNDLIDMGHAANRRKVEIRFQANLERDRARSTVLPISRFGLLEMTRQRIRPSVLESHYVNCLHCDGLGKVKLPEEAAADATRHCGWLLHHAKVRKVEIVCSPAVGSYLLSNKRAELNQYEDKSGKRIIVRISEEIATDRIVHYAYDERGSDMELSSLPNTVLPTIASLIKLEETYAKSGDLNKNAKTGRRRSRRRGRNKLPLADASTVSLETDFEDELALLDKPEVKAISQSTKKKPSDSKDKETPADVAMRVYQFAKEVGKTSKEIIDLCKTQNLDVRNHMSKMSVDVITTLNESFEDQSEKKKPRRRRRRRGGRKNAKQVAATTTSEDQGVPTESASKKASNKRSTQKRRTRKRSSSEKNTPTSTESKPDIAPKLEEKKKPRRTLYGGRRRNVTSEELQASMEDRA